MPLPDAPPVETSRIYQQFKGLNALGNVTGAISSDLMDNIRLQQFVDFNSEDELRRMLLVGLASQTMSAAGPIANTGRIEVITATANSTLLVFRPNAGEVWQLTAASATSTGGAVRFKLGLITGDSVAIVESFIEIADESPSSTGIQFSFDGLPGPLFIDQNAYMVCNFSSMTGGEEGECRCAFIRVR
tara:strand:+ start:38 stop:601 length:564 start_codon:yes stop_codon:yes gene_type:complete